MDEIQIKSGHDVSWMSWLRGLTLASLACAPLLGMAPAALGGEALAPAAATRAKGLQVMERSAEADPNAAEASSPSAAGQSIQTRPKPSGDAAEGRAIPGRQTSPGANPGRPASKPGSSLGTKTSSAAARQAGTLKPTQAPKLEVKQGSGDFTNWTEQMVVDTSQLTLPVHLRWTNPGWSAKEARWVLRRGDPNTTRARGPALKTGSAGNVPGQGMSSFFNVTLESASSGLPPALRYWVEVELVDENGATLATTNNAIIDYKKPSAGPPQQIHLDQLTVTSVTPTSGKLQGSPSGSPAPVDYIEIQFNYDLITETEAALKAYGRTAQGTSPNGSKHYVITVDKGKGNDRQRVWWECLPGGPNMAYTSIDYKLLRKSDMAVLAKGTYELSAPVIFDCGSQITQGLPKQKVTLQAAAARQAGLIGPHQVSIQSTSPGGGSLMGIVGSSFQPGNHFEITYQYDLAEGALPARISQWAEDANGNVLPGNYWTFGHVNQDTGTVTTKMALRCDGDYAEHGSRKITRIRYVLMNTGDNVKLLEATKPVNYTVSCPGQHLRKAIQTNLEAR